MRIHRIRNLAALGIVMTCGPTLHAQVATALLRAQGSNGVPGETITAINNTAVNSSGGYAVTINVLSGTASLSQVWGSFTPGPGSVIRSEGTFGLLVQTAYETFFGIGDTTVGYSPTGTGGPVGAFDSVWVNDIPIAVEGNPHPTLAGQFWRFGSRPSITSDGTLWWVGGLATTPGGTTSNRGLFTGNGTPVLLGNTNVMGFAEVINTGTAVDFDFRVSASGLNYIAPIVLSAPTTSDTAVVRNGQAAAAGSGVLREGTPVAADAGGINSENWSAFRFFGANDAGAWLMTADTTNATTADEVVVFNGQIILREGAVIDGATIAGITEGAYLNNDGDYAVIWDIQNNTIECLIVNGRIVLREGQTVDWDGDGVPEPTSILTDFTGISTLSFGDRQGLFAEAYFTADVNVNGTVMEGYFRMPVEVRPNPVGDMNCDGVVNAADAAAFCLAVNDFSAYSAQYPTCDPLNGDVDQNGRLDHRDIDPFLDLTCSSCSCFCPCDINGSGTVTSQDFFDFLSHFFSGDTRADINNDGSITSQDFFDFIACFFGGCPSVLDRFASPHALVADYAYMQLFHMGADGIGPLMTILNNMNPYSGGAYYNENSSLLVLEPPPVAFTAIYLIDAILLDQPAPHFAPVLIGPDEIPPSVALSQAIAAYNQWWQNSQGLTLGQLRAAPSALSFTNLQFLGPVLAVQAAPLPGIGRVTGPRTPAKHAPPKLERRGANDYTFFVEKNAGAVVPYNCLAWAMNCNTGGWMVPHPGVMLGGMNVPAKTPQDILMAEGYNTTPVACAGQCPAGRGPKAMMIHRTALVGPPAPLSTSNWAHAMKQEADGDWTSKNGQGSLYGDITNDDNFLETYYKPDANQINVKTCYCK